MKREKKQSHNRLKFAIVVLVLLIVSILGVGYHNLPQKVQVETMKYEVIPFYYRTKVPLTPGNLIVVKSNVTTKIEKYLVNPGQWVKSGQTIAEYDKLQLEKQIEQLNKGLENKTKPTLNGNNENDALQLLKAGIITEKEYKEKLANNEGDDEENIDESKLEADVKKEIAKLKEAYEKPIIVANANGMLSVIYHQDEKVAIADRPFAVIQQGSPLYGTIVLPIPVDKEGLKAKLLLAKDNRELDVNIRSARIIEIDGSEQTVVELSVNNKGAILKPGTTYDIVFIAPESFKAIRVPKDAIYEKYGEHFVYTVNDGNLVDIQVIEIGQEKGNCALVVSGLYDDQKVIVSKGDYQLGEYIRY